MKKFFLKYSRMLIIFFMGASFFSSCTYKEVLDIPYPESTIYMSQASVATLGPNANGVYTITPNVEGLLYRYIADVAANKFNVPLGIIRSGLNLSGVIPVNIAVNTDTITKLITAGKFAAGTEQLPSTAYTIPSSVNLEDGSANASFDIVLNLNFLITNITKKYAIAVGITSSGSKTVQSKLATTVIFIDPALVLLPVSNFSGAVDNIAKTGSFFNLSANGKTYSWNYGDGSAAETLISPIHKYAASGTYTVTLTTTGITGTPSVKTTNIVIL